MKDIILYYTRQCGQLKESITTLNRKIHRIGTLRLLLVLAGVLLLYLFRQENIWTLTAIIAACLLPYLFLMQIHNRLFSKRNYQTQKLKLNENELKAQAYDFSLYDGAPELSDNSHSFAQDIDLFGNHSLFQSVNRTVTEAGKMQLANWFLSPCSQKAEIESRQQAVRELASRPEFFQHFHTVGNLSHTQSGQYSRLTHWCLNFHAKFSHPVYRILTLLVPLGWLILGTGYLTGLVAGVWLNTYLLATLIFTLSQKRSVNAVYNQSDQLHNCLKIYAQLIQLLEQTPVQAGLLCQIRNQFQKDGTPVSSLLHRFTGHVHVLEQRLSLASLVLNLLTLRDIRHAIALEKWMDSYRHEIPRWIEALGHFDALLSLGNYAFAHPDYTYPTVEDHYFVLQAQALAHPLMHRDQCVANDIHITDKAQFLIVTGANMAGKSTYLRTVAVNFLLGCTGLPVCAQQMTFCPAHLVTSLRTSDSLNEHESYFFAELKRLKMIIDRLKAGERLFIILDEILKGTNSADKQKGSLALIRQLLSYQASGIIATHDLILGTLADEFPGQVFNFCFEADIQDNELTFSYKIRKGIAQNMNACFLMRKMNITV